MFVYLLDEIAIDNEFWFNKIYFWNINITIMCIKTLDQTLQFTI